MQAESFILSFAVRKLVFFCMWLYLVSSCIPRRGGSQGPNDSDIKINLYGLNSADLPATSQFQLSDCQSVLQSGTLESPNRIKFENVPFMPSGTTCTLRISQTDTESDQDIQWMGTKGLLYQDRHVVIVKEQSNTRRGDARHLTRMFERSPQTKSPTVSLTTRVDRGLLKIGGPMDASLTCIPFAPYFAAVTVNSFDESGRGELVFVLPESKQEAVNYKCVSMSVFRDRVIVGQAILEKTAQFKVDIGQKAAEIPEVFRWYSLADLGHDVQINPELEPRK